jgi:hypothetical protein
VTGNPKECSKPFCDGPCDADLHECPPAVIAVINETGTACPDCTTSGFGFVSEYRMDERPVHLVIVWHADTCPSMARGGYLIAALPETALKTGAAISDALEAITDADIRYGEFANIHDTVIARHDRGEVTLPQRAVETARKISGREAHQDARRAREEAGQ